MSEFTEHKHTQSRDDRVEKHLEDHGSGGWELVTCFPDPHSVNDDVGQTKFYWKREIPPQYREESV